ncbi:uncharacterized protein LOC129774209 [Toxorhynchites rutilus septentrionalis]|uniref:uncharacterized protein LOC129774209 n=1 Tax=Toxorhynchites rutilus septentrionalis TaxID=329112 RepID=UPI0024786AA1|nr:uncharacterized protein LOC129774209 [Toxorhynchites rutilus septentrionalis]
MGCNVFIVHQDSIISFMERFFEYHDEATFRDPNKTIVMLMDSSQSDEKYLLRELCEHPNLVEVLNLLMLKPTANMKYIELITHRFVGTAEESVDLLLLDVFDIANKTFRHGRQLFPDKITNLQGKVIRVAAFNVPPMVIMHQNYSSYPSVKSGNQMYEVYGSDGLLIKKFCRRYNCSVELILDEVNQWGTIYSNRTGNGVLGNLLNRRADIGFGGLSGWHTPLNNVSITCIFQGSTYMESHAFSFHSSSLDLHHFLVSKFQTGSSAVLQDLADQGNAAFAIGRLINDHLMIGGWITAGNVHKYQIMREELYYDHEVSMATKT